jgi:hypothetical protein
LWNGPYFTCEMYVNSIGCKEPMRYILKWTQLC